MKPYQIKVDKEFQNQKVLEYQQEQYRKIMTDSTEFYDKYFDVLKTGSLVRTDTYNTVSFESDDKSKVTAKGFAGASVDNYTVSVTKLASKATHTFENTKLSTSDKIFVQVDGKDIEVDIVKTGTEEENMKETVKKLNEALNTKGIDISAKYSQFSKGIVLESGQIGEDAKFSAVCGSNKDDILNQKNTYQGTNLNATIVKADGSKYSISDDENKTNSNFKTIDNVEFNFKGTTEIKDKDGKLISETPVQLSGTTDVKDIKDKIVNFVNDYNKLLESINTKIYETRDKDYMPLTDEQKKEMSEDQVKAWEKKAQAGLLRKDNDLERITSEMKRVMSSVMSGSGLCLEKIGIKPVKNYAEKNGMFTIDENKLTQALEENAENVKDLFTRPKPTDTNSKDKGGVFTQLSSVLTSEFKTSSSILSKKAGLSGSSTEFNNLLSKNIDKKKQLISQLMKSLGDKENALYKKYSNLETLMQNLNAQQSSLSQMLGQA